MGTATKPIVLKYNATNLGKFKGTTKYQLETATSGNLNGTDLTELLNVSTNQDCANSKPIYWLQIRGATKWVKPYSTGLFKTEFQNIYKGDTQKRRNKLIFVFSELRQILTVYYFKDLNYPNFYKADLSSFKDLLNNSII